MMRKFIDILNESISHTEQLDEAPIADMSFVGDWSKNSSYKEQDRKLLSNPKAVKKIQNMWKYPEDVDTNAIFVNNKEARNHSEVGQVTPDWFEKNMPDTAPYILPMIRNDQINIVYTNNNGSERVPMTGWIMAHRFGHALTAARYGKDSSHYFKEAALTLARYLADLAKQYGIEPNGIGRGDRRLNAILAPNTTNLLQDICTFRSARERELRNSYEAVYELFAQFIFTGEIKFNDIPKRTKVGRSFFGYRGGDDYDYDNRTIQQDLAYELKEYFETACHQAVGKIFVM